MTELFQNAHFLDLLAPLWFIVCWAGYTSFSNSRWANERSLMSRVHEYRRLWLTRMIRRDNHITDIQVIHALMRTVAFLAQTALFVVAGLVAVLGARDTVVDVLSDMPFAEPPPPALIDLKIITLVVIFVYAFFKCTWSLRQYNYVSIMIGSAPEQSELNADALNYVERTAQTLTLAGEHFNKSIRAFYFGLAALSWFLHPLLFMAISTWLVAIIFRREFRSNMLHHLGPVGSRIACDNDVSGAHQPDR